MSEQGWPTLADVHREVQATRRELRGMCTEMRQGRRELDDHERRIRSLHSWSKRIGGGLAVLVLLVTVGAPVALWTVGG